MPDRPDSWTALITGGTIGIGEATAYALGHRGAAVAVTYLSHPPHATLAALEATGVHAVAHRLDATDPDQVRDVVDKVASEFGTIDVLVNNAGGLVARVPFPEMTQHHWDTVMAVNVSTAVNVTQAVLPYMSAGWGRIVNVSSLAAESGGGNGAAAYTTSKAALIGLTRALAKELAPRGITVNAVSPGLILQTPFHETFTSAAAQRSMIEGIPVGRAGCPEDVAAAIASLVGPQTGFITGVVLDVNGGVSFR